MSDFQEEIHAEGLDKFVIIGVGKDFLQDNWGGNFTANSILPLVLDTSPEFPIREAYNAAHKEIVFLDSEGNLIDRIQFGFNDIPSYKAQMRELIIRNYPSGVAGDLNGDEIVNILDIVGLVNIILGGSYEEAGDLNSDGSNNILDIVQLVNIILENS